MFRSSVQSTAFTSPGAEEYFSSRIYGMNYNGDVSFLSTLRALLGPRTKEGDTVCLQFNQVNGARVETASIGDVPRHIAPPGGLYDDANTITISNVSTVFMNDDNRDKVMDKIKKAFKNIEGYAEYPEIATFYQKAFNVLCFINPIIHNVIVYVENLDLRKLHYLQVSTLALFQWYFNKEQSITEDEMALIKSLRETNETEYLNCLNKLASAYDFRSACIRKLLTGFESQHDRLRLEELYAQLVNYDSRIQEYMNRISNQLREKENTRVNIMGLEKKLADPSSENSELMEYFIANKKLILDRVEDSTVFFTVKDYITYFDKEAAEQVINNPRSPFYNRSSARVSDDKIKKLLTEIFLTDKPRLRIKTCAAYSVNVAGRDVHGRSRYSYSSECSDCIPNMHIEHHSCIGDYAQIFAELLTEGNYVGIIEQCIASCKSLNFYDGTVIMEFAYSLITGADYNNKCIELPDGTVVKPADAVRWLDEQGASEDGQEK